MAAYLILTFVVTLVGFRQGVFGSVHRTGFSEQTENKNDDSNDALLGEDLEDEDSSL